MVRVAVLDDWQGIAESSTDWSALQAGAQVTFFKQSFQSEEDAAESLRDFEIVLSMRERTPFPASLIYRLPSLRMLGITGRASASLDLDACSTCGVLVCNTKGGGGSEAATAELALGLLLSAARFIPLADANIRAGRFQEDVPAGVSLAGKCVGIVGLGRLGSQMARYCHGLGMSVLAWSPHLTRERAEAAGAVFAEKGELFSRCDAISVHMVLSPGTLGLITAQDLARLKPGAIFVNTSRAAIVDGKALLSEVQSGRVFAALDVFEHEPLPLGDPWRHAPNTVLTPHLGYSVHETWREFYGQSVENALAFLRGHPIRVVNPAAFPREA